MRITAFIGAGAAVEIGGPLSTQLTSSIRSIKQEYREFKTGIKRERFLLNEIGETLDHYYTSAICNFEEIFDTLEFLSSYSAALETHSIQRFKPTLGAFININKKELLDPVLLNTAKMNLIENVADIINDYCNRFDPNSKDSWYASFWRTASHKVLWDIFTLNYDNCLEKVLPMLEDGFEKLDPGIYRFDPKKIYFCSKKSRILHLHGSIFYGYPRFQDPNRFVFDDSFEDLYKFDDYQKAKGTWFWRSTNTSQSRLEAIIGPLITGLRKTDKIIAYPYSSYYSLLEKVQIENSRLLIAGYSFSDFHFNKLLSRVSRIHKKDRRIVIISHFPDKKMWHSDPNIMNWPNQDMFDFIAKSFRQSPVFNNNSYKNPIYSDDKCVRLYLKGMKHAIENHGQEIIDFLSS